MDKNGLKIVFMGSPEMALTSLKALLESEDPLIAVVSQPDRPAGRGRALTSPPVASFARERGIPLLQPEKIKGNPDFFHALKELSPDLIVVVAYGKILPKEILTLPPKKCINLHFSLLPKYRGAAPLSWALMNDESETGVTTFYLTEKLDAGPLLLQKKVVIEPEDHAEILENRLAIAGANLLKETIEKIKGGDIDPLPQNEHLVTFAPPLKKEDGLIQWDRKAKIIWSQIRGMTPRPGAFTYWNGKIFKIYRAEVGGEKRGTSMSGEVIGVNPEGLEVACHQATTLLVKEVQLEGGRKMEIGEFLRGHPIRIGERLGH